jgi:exodeoxyribonuclease-1
MSQPTFFWYDLETSGINPRDDRIMQFAGQRTSLELEPIGEPVNILIRLTDDVLPSPDAVLVTGITPQMTLSEGVTEAAFLKTFHEAVAIPGTTFVGYNSVRFDDEFMRHLLFRNFYDAYAWQWQDDRSRWDLLDAVRMTRALRPNGIQWPVVDGKPTNSLEQLTQANGIEHANAHDALADVEACIAVARLIRTNHPKLFDWLVSTRHKNAVKTLVEKNDPFVYASGKYDSNYEKTTVAVRLASHPKGQGSLVYDLRHDPSEYIDLSPSDLVERWRWTRDSSAPTRLPVKTLQYNRCPAVAPLGVLDALSQQRLQLSLVTIQTNLKKLRAAKHFVKNVEHALAVLDQQQQQRIETLTLEPEAQLYDSFVDKADTQLLGVLRAADPAEIASVAEGLVDKRLRAIAPHYKARNFATTLTDDERSAWEAYRYGRLMEGGTKSQVAKFMHRLGEIAKTTTNPDKLFLLEELQLYAESIMPIQDA